MHFVHLSSVKLQNAKKLAILEFQKTSEANWSTISFFLS